MPVRSLFDCLHALVGGLAVHAESVSSGKARVSIVVLLLGAEAPAQFAAFDHCDAPGEPAPDQVNDGLLACAAGAIPSAAAHAIPSVRRARACRRGLNLPREARA